MPDPETEESKVVVVERSHNVKLPNELSWTGNMSDNWSFFKQKFELYLIASKATKENCEYKIALLLSTIGDKALKIFNNFTYEKSEVKTDFKEVLKKFDSYFLPEKNLTYERHMFFLRQQNDSESIDDYVTELKNLSSSCEFGNLTDSLIKDRIVLGIKDRAIKDRLLRISDLNLTKAVDTCRAAERTKAQLDEISPINAGPELHKINRNGKARQVQYSRGKASTNHGGHGSGFLPTSIHHGGQSNVNNNNKRLRFHASDKVCSKCGFKHSRYSCPAFGKVCLKCNKLNHFSSKCRSKNVSTISNNNLSENVDELFIGSICSQLENTWSVNLDTNGTNVNFKIDTGAQANIITLKTLESIKNPIKLIETKTNLSSYTGQKIKVMGKCTLPCSLNNETRNIDFFVVDETAPCILGLQTSVSLNLIHKNNEMISQCKVNKVGLGSNKPKLDPQEPNNIMDEYKDLYVGIGCLKDTYDIKLKPNAVPKIHAPRKVPFLLKQKLKQKLDDLVKLNIISKVEKPTEWVNSLVIVNKPNGDIRLCIDCKDLNESIMRQHYPLQTFDEISNKLNGATVFSVLDTKDAFWSIKLSDESADLCTFNTPFGRYKFLRLPYGLCSASEIFSQRMRQMLENIEGVDVFVDDVIIWGRDIKEHNARLKCVLDKFRAENVKLNKSKSKIAVSELTFLGHKISKDGISVDEDKLRAISNMDIPHDKKSLERFLGMITYLSKFIPNVSNLTAPLRSILRKNADFQWNHEQQPAFVKLKEILMKKPVLQFFDCNKPIVISVDSSKDGIGTVLLQNSHPVAYASKALNQVQASYAQIEKELLSVLYGCEKFHQFIYGAKSVTIETDHKPLVSIINKNIEDCPPRLQRMLIRLQKYNFTLVYKKGKELYISDTLSRAFDKNSDLDMPCLEPNEIEAQICSVIDNFNISESQLSSFVNSTKNDPELSTLKKFIPSWPSDKSKVPDVIKHYWSVRNELSIYNDLVLKGNTLVVPKNLRSEMLNRIHFTHCGVNKSVLRAKNVLYWPNMTLDIQNFISKCEPCTMYSNENRRQPLLPHKVPDLPWQKVGIDLLELDGNRYMLVTDYFSKYPELISLPSITAENVIHGLKQIFSRHGIPSMVVTDSGSQFTSNLFQDFAKSWCFNCVTSSPHHHQSNGMVERAIQSIKNILHKASVDKKDVYLVLLEYRNTPIDDKIPSPAEILFSRKLRGILPFSYNDLKPKVNPKVKKYLIQKQNKQKMYFDRNTRKLRDLSKNEIVLFKTALGTWVKGTIIRQHTTPRSYVVECIETGRIFVRNRIHLKPLNVFGHRSDNFYDDDDNQVPKPVVNPVVSPNTSEPKSPVNRPNLSPLDRGRENQYTTRSGRSVVPPQRLNL